MTAASTTCGSIGNRLAPSAPPVLRYLGATPVAVAQTRRVHFAKKLIDETDLSMTQIAMAAGFGSIRRFNATFQNLYARAPAICEKHASTPSPVTARPATIRSASASGRRINSMPILEFLARPRDSGRRNGYERRISAHHLARWTQPGSSPCGRLRRSRGNYLEVQIRYPEPRALFRIVERVRRIFDAAPIPTAIARRLQSDARLKPVLQAHPGLRVPGCWDGFEMAVRAILGQQVSVKGASTMAGRVAAAFGERTIRRHRFSARGSARRRGPHHASESHGNGLVRFAIWLQPS